MPQTYPDHGTILLDGEQYPLVGGTLLVQDLGTWQPRITIGDPSLDSQQHMSTWALSDFSGGEGITEHFTDATVNRYRFSTLDISRPGMWTQRLRVDTENGTAGAWWPLGVVGGVLYSTFGTDVHSWNETTNAWTDTVDNLTGAPVNTAVVFQGTGGTTYLYIPLGTSYDVYDGATVTNTASPNFKDFAVLGQSLIGLDDVNQLHHSEDGTTWTSFGAEGKIPPSTTAYTLRVYRDSSDNPSLIISTSGHVYVFDPQGPTLYEQDLWFPTHPDQGLAACAWRGTYYVSVGTGVHSWNSATGSIDQVGLDRDDGLPYLYGLNSRIVSMVPAYNEMYALVQGSTADSSRPSVHRFDGTGWHPVWEHSTTGTATRLHISQADSTYRVWWGVGNSSYTIELPRGFTNPKQMTANSSTNGLDSGSHYFETGLTDMGMPGFRKIAHSAKLRMAIPQDDVSNTGQPFLYYRTKEGGSYTLVNEASGIVWPAGGGVVDYFTLNFYFGDAFVGVPFDEIELKLVTFNQYFIGKYLTMDFIKIPRKNNAWTATLDLTMPHDHSNPNIMSDAIAALIDTERIITMVHHKTTYYVRLASWNGSDNTGIGDFRNTRTIQILETRFDDNS
jgi:hypothetical protein